MIWPGPVTVIPLIATVVGLSSEVTRIEPVVVSAVELGWLPMGNAPSSTLEVAFCVPAGWSGVSITTVGLLLIIWPSSLKVGGV